VGRCSAAAAVPTLAASNCFFALFSLFLCARQIDADEAPRWMTCTLGKLWSAAAVHAVVKLVCRCSGCTRPCAALRRVMHHQVMRGAACTRLPALCSSSAAASSGLQVLQTTAGSHLPTTTPALHAMKTSGRKGPPAQLCAAASATPCTVCAVHRSGGRWPQAQHAAAAQHVCALAASPPRLAWANTRASAPLQCIWAVEARPYTGCFQPATGARTRGTEDARARPG
jgi:hypothetical protein